MSLFGYESLSSDGQMSGVKVPGYPSREGLITW